MLRAVMNRKGFLAGIVGLGAAVLFAGSAFADNVRPVAPTIGAEQSLQSIVDDLSVAGGGFAGQINVGSATRQTGQIDFTPGGNNAVATFVVEIAGHAGSNAFGLYKIGDTSKKIEIFGGSDTSAATRAVNFNGDGSVSTTLATTLNFGTHFGFYIKVGDGPLDYFYSDDIQNGGNAQALIFRGSNDDIKLPNSPFARKFLSTDLLIAFEDTSLSGNSDRDYNDLVVFVSLVPEPGTIALLGLGLAAGVAARRRRRQAA